MGLEEEWANFSANMENSLDTFDDYLNTTAAGDTDTKSYNPRSNCLDSAPPCTKLKISTKSKIVYLNQKFELRDLFWKLPIINYDDECEGIIKKQMKFNFSCPADVTDFESKIVNERQVKSTIITQINNPNGRVSFKDVRKVDIGFSKNDVLKPNKPSKSAFYNCFVIIFRKIYRGVYREFHAKLFNSGKVEIPGIQNDEMLEIAVDFLVNVLRPHCPTELVEVKSKRELVLVNSNFNCQYYLNRETLLDILKTKYKIKCNMDSCSYPGIQCKYSIGDNKEVSFMIFRTGSVLIVGKCDDVRLNEIYEFLVNIFQVEYKNIYEEQSELEIIEKQKSSNKKKSRKTIAIYI